MISVSNLTKQLFKKDSTHKQMIVKIYDVAVLPYVFGNEDIYYESFELSESILDGSTMTFMGCISSEMRVTIRNTNNFREEQFNDSKITVEVTPYDEVNTKNQMPPLRMAGNKDTINGITYTVNDNLSVDVVGTATDDSEYEIAHFTVMEDKTLVLSGCPSGVGVTGEFDGTLEIKHLDGTFESYEDVGFDIQVEFEEGDECIYKIFVAQGQTVNTTFYPMLRETTETSTYEHYGTELVAADTVMLFTGYIDNGHYDQDKGWLKLTAYDVLSKLSSFNVWNWYRTAFSNGAMNLDDLLDSFATYVDTNSGYDFELSLTRCPVILEDVKIKKQLNNKEMTATEFLKSFCQLACGMGMIDRNGKFQIIYMNAQASGSETITYYRGLTAKDFVATPFTEGITIRTNNDDNGVTVLAPEQYDPSIWNSDTYDTYVIDNDDQAIVLGKYIIETNGIVKKLSVAKRRAILSIDLNNLPTAYYTFKSYELQCNGLPYLECGDRIVYQPTLQDTPIAFNVVSRKLKGIQAMVDTYSFEIDPHKKYGGSTSKKKDEIASGNVENEGSVNNMTTISVTENGTYEPYDYDAMGFSSVTVDVAGGEGKEKYYWETVGTDLGTMSDLEKNTLINGYTDTAAGTGTADYSIVQSSNDINIFQVGKSNSTYWYVGTPNNQNGFTWTKKDLNFNMWGSIFMSVSGELYAFAGYYVYKYSAYLRYWDNIGDINPPDTPSANRIYIRRTFALTNFEGKFYLFVPGWAKVYRSNNGMNFEYYDDFPFNVGVPFSDSSYIKIHAIVYNEIMHVFASGTEDGTYNAGMHYTYDGTTWTKLHDVPFNVYDTRTFQIIDGMLITISVCANLQSNFWYDDGSDMWYPFVTWPGYNAGAYYPSGGYSQVGFLRAAFNYSGALHVITSAYQSNNTVPVWHWVLKKSTE